MSNTPEPTPAPVATAPAPVEAAPAVAPIASAADDIITEERDDKAVVPAPVAPPAPVALADTAQHDRAQAFRSIMAEFLKSTASMSPDMQQSLTDKVVDAVSRFPADKAFYERVMGGPIDIYIAAASMDPSGTVHTFLCAQGSRTRISQSFQHAMAAPAGSAYSVRMTDKIPHRGAYNGNPLSEFSDRRGCDKPMKTLQRTLGGTAELAAVPTTPTIGW